MSVSLSIEIFAMAVGVEGSCGIGQVSHHIEIVTETDVIYLPVIASIFSVLIFSNYVLDSCSSKQLQ